MSVAQSTSTPVQPGRSKCVTKYYILDLRAHTHSTAQHSAAPAATLAVYHFTQEVQRAVEDNGDCADDGDDDGGCGDAASVCV